MIGLGTIINTAAIAVGGVCGKFFGRWLTDRHQDTLLKTCGVAVLFLAISGVLSKTLSLQDGALASGRALFMTLCLTLGALLGESLNIEAAFARFGEWLKRKTKSEGDGGFVGAFVTASLTVSIGAMAVVGSIRDGIFGDYSILVTKAVLDFVIVMVMTCSMGKGCAFSALSVLAVEGSLTLLARLIRPLMTDAALDNLSLVGSVLIFCVGVNLVFGKKIRVANLLPSLLIAVGAAFLPFSL